MAGYKDYVLEFKLGDGTMHSIPFRVPLGENGGYYTPAISQISETEIEIRYVPSMADMPTIKPAVIKIPGSGGNVEKHNTDPTSHADIRKRLDVSNIVETASGESVVLDDASNMDLAGLKVYGKTTQNGTPTPDTPIPLQSVGLAGSVDVTICGKNLFTEGIIYGGGLDHSYGQLQPTAPLTSPATRPAWAGVGIRVAVSPNTDYTVSSDITPCDYFTVTFYRNMEDVTKYTNAISFIENVKTNRTSFRTPAECRCVVITAVSRAAAVFTWNWWMCEPGTTASEYDTFEKSQVLTLSTPNGLAGIPVSSDGNYTDKNGQLWICDEVDFTKGVYIQRIGKINGYTGEGVTGAYMSNTGELSYGATVLYVLPKPIEETVAADELLQYATLHTNYPNTIVINDGGADMELKYVADTKRYIDNKFAELSTALLNQ